MSSPPTIPSTERPNQTRRRRPSIARTRHDLPDQKDKGLVDKWNETITGYILLESIFFTGIATMVACISELTPHDLSVSSTLLTVLGLVLGLVIGFRTTSAYERYQEGRKLWADIAVASGGMAQLLWTYLPGELPHEEAEKTEVLRLIEAFSISVKQFLCIEDREAYVAELTRLVPWLPGLHKHNILSREVEDGTLSNSGFRDMATVVSSPTTPSGKLDMDITEEGLPTFMAGKNTDNRTRPFQRFPTSWWRRFPGLKSAKLAKIAPPRSILPLQICMILHEYLRSLRSNENPIVPDGIICVLLNYLTTFHQSVTNLERIRTTPLPYAYQIHLQCSLWVYLTFLPFQIVDQMKWATIPGTLFSSLLLLGFHAIGQQIENPFNGDANDLDMNAFTKCIAIEIEEICQNPGPASFRARLESLKKDGTSKISQETLYPRSSRRPAALKISEFGASDPTNAS